MITAAQVSLVRVALVFGLVNAIVPGVIVSINPHSVTELAFALGWVGAWATAVWAAPAILRLIERTPTRLAFVAATAAATVGTVLATGGLDSRVINGGYWIGWAATVVATPLASLGIASVFSASVLGAFVVSGTPPAQLFDHANRYFVVTAILNPFVVVLVALALAGVFRSVIVAAPSSLWKVRHGGPATSSGLTSLFGSEPIALLAAPQAEGHDDHHAPPEDTALRGARLSGSETTIVSLLIGGLAPKQIARELGHSLDYVYELIASAKAKVGARTIDQLVVLAWVVDA